QRIAHRIDRRRRFQLRQKIERKHDTLLYSPEENCDDARSPSLPTSHHLEDHPYDGSGLSPSGGAPNLPDTLYVINPVTAWAKCRIAYGMTFTSISLACSTSSMRFTRSCTRSPRLLGGGGTSVLLSSSNRSMAILSHSVSVTCQAIASGN